MKANRKIHPRTHVAMHQKKKWEGESGWIAVLACGIGISLCLLSGPVFQGENQLDEAVGMFPTVSDASPDGVTASGSSVVSGSCAVELGSFEAFSTSEEESRAANISIATKKLNGIVMQPGDTLSFNEAVDNTGPDSEYEVATVMNGNEKDQDVGGGICEVSTALYVAAVNSGLEIVERHPHTTPVDYAPIGLDATVDSETMDLVIRNPTSSTLTIKATSSGQTVRISFVGAEPKGTPTANATSQIVSLAQSQTDDGDDVTIYTVRSYRTYFENGTAVRSELLGEDVYIGGGNDVIELVGGTIK